MNNYQQIEKDISYQSEDLIDVDYDKLEKGWEKWDIGQKIGWLYKEEFDFYKDEFLDEIKKHGKHGRIFKGEQSRFDLWIKSSSMMPYQGILFTLPEKRFCIHDTAVLCIFDYPIQKENPVCDWISFNRFLEQKDLYKVYKL